MDWTFFATPIGLVGVIALVLALRGDGGKSVSEVLRAWRAKPNGHLDAAKRRDSGPTELPVFMTREEGEELERLLRDRTHAVANAAQEALSKAEVVERRQDKHSRILMDVQTAMAEHRGETRARLEGLWATCDEVKADVKEQRTLLQSIAAKLGV